MERKKKFTIYYNNDETIGFGKGYYIIFENFEGKPTFDSKYGTFEYSEFQDLVSVGLINKMFYMYDLGYVFDRYYEFNFKELF